MPDGIWTLLLLAGLAVAVWLGFKLLDRYLKPSKKPKKAADKKEEKTESPAPAEKETAPEQMPINAGPNLADEMEKMIASSAAPAAAATGDRVHTSARRRIRAFDRMAKYRESKNYEDFNYDSEAAETEATADESIKLTAEDYKKVVAFSHIDAPK